MKKEKWDALKGANQPEQTQDAKELAGGLKKGKKKGEQAKEGAGTEQQSRRDFHLDLCTQIKEVLKDKDRMDRAELAAQLNAPAADFNQAVIQMQEAGELRNEEIGTQTLLFIPLTPDQEKRFVELVATIKGADKTKEEALEEIRTGRLYRMMYKSWPDFLHHVMDMTIDQWKDYRTKQSVKKLMDEAGLKIKCAPSALLEFAPLRKWPEAFVEALKDFQGLAEKKWTVQVAKGIVKRHLALADDLERLRRTVPDCTREEAGNLRFLRERWDKEVIEQVQRVMTQARSNWNKDLTAKVQELVQGGKPTSESLLAVCKESQAYPSDEGILLTVRGDDLYRVVQGIRRLVNEDWLPAYQKQEARKKLEREAKNLGLSIFDPDHPPPAPPAPPAAPAEGRGASSTTQSPAAPPEPPTPEPPPPEPPSPEKEEEDLYPDSISLDNSLIVWAEGNTGEPYDLPFLLGIAKDAALIAAHRAKTNNEWDAGVLNSLAVAIRDALEPFLQKPAGETEGDRPPAEQT